MTDILWVHVTHHLLYWKNSSESIKLSLSLSETQVIIFVWKIDSSRALVRAWLVVWLSGNDRGFMLIPAGSESGHQGMSVFSTFFLENPQIWRGTMGVCVFLLRAQRWQPSSRTEGCVCMCGKEKETNLIVSPLYLSQR